jgi:type VI secretion system ImpM family protein
MVVPLSAPAVGSAPRWRPALFGKLPAHGDFVCRAMNEAERGAWDRWASEGLSAARAALGDRFEAAHDTAPLWNFVCRSDVVGTGWSVGAVAPSMDRAGRRFVIVMAYLDVDWADVIANAERLAAVCTEAIYCAFGGGMDADASVQFLAEKALAPRDASLLAQLAAPASDGSWWTLDRERHVSAVVHGTFTTPDTFIRLIAPVEDGQ